MTRLLAAALAASMLAGCGAAPVGTPTRSEAGPTQAQSSLTRITGTVSKTTLASQQVLTMSIEAKRPLAKNFVQNYAFYTFMDQQTRRWRGSSSGSGLYLSKDGGIYISSGATNTELWYRVGTYEAPQSGRLRVGDPLSYRLDGEHQFKVSNGAIHLDIFHAYQTAHGSEMEFTTKAPQLVNAE